MEIKVLTLVHNLTIGGVQRGAQNFALSIQKHGYESKVCCVKGGVREEYLHSESIPVINLESYDIKEAISEIKKWGPDIVHIHQHGGILLPEYWNIVKSLKKSKPNLVVVEKNSFGVPNYKIPDFFDVHIVLSKWMLWKWQEWAGDIQNGSECVVIPNMINEDDFFPVESNKKEEIRKKYGVKKGDILFGRVGQPIGSKWSEVIFSSFKKLAEERGDVKLLLVGVPDRFLKLIDTFPADIRERIIILDTINNDDLLRAIYCAMDVFLHAAEIGESFGNVIAESMLCKTPVITLSTPLRSNTQVELVGHKIGGLVAGSQNQYFSHMKELADSRDSIEQYGENARARILEGYSIHKVEKEYIILLENIMKNKKFKPGDSKLVHKVNENYPKELLSKNGIDFSYYDSLLMLIIKNRHIYRLYKYFRDRNRVGIK